MRLFRRRNERRRIAKKNADRKSRLALECLEKRVLLSAQYTVTDLGTLGGTFGAGLGINDQGQVAGYTTDALSETVAFSWEDGSIESAMDAFWIDEYSRAFDINNTGFIVGGAEVTFAVDRERAVYVNPLMSTVFNIHTAGISSEYSSRALGVNDLTDTPTIVGYITDTSDTRHAFSWKSSTGMISLSGSASQANDVNDSNRIVGSLLTYTGLGDYDHAGYWQGGMWVDIDADNPFGSSAVGVNNNGDIVGWQHTGFGSDFHAFVWSSSGGLQTLGNLDGDDLGSSSDARAINEAGQVVGASDIDYWDDQSYPYRAFLYDDGEMHNLEDLTTNVGSWKLLVAEDINNSGQIVGWGRLGGNVKGFLLTPEASGDTELPTANLSGGDDITEEGTTDHDLMVTYIDNVGVDVSTLDGSDIRVTGPGGFDAAATFQGVDVGSDGTPRVATYQIAAPGGAWDADDNGTYSITVVADQVGDTSGNNVAAGLLGLFQVNIDGETPSGGSGPKVLAHEPSIVTAGQFDSFEVTFDKTINAGTFTGADVTLTGPDSSPIGATSVTFVSGLTYEVGFAGQSGAGTYTLTIGPNIQDSQGNKMDQDGDETNGEAQEDVYTGTVQVAPSGLLITTHSPKNTVTGPVGEINVTFSREIEPDTFGITDIVLTGPDGTVGIDTIVQVDDFDYRIEFADQGTAGSYTISVGPDIETPAGQKMNQDGDGTAGEAGEDVYNGSFSIGTSDLKIDSHDPSTPQSSEIDHVEVTFSQAIDEETFAAEDVQITGPSGAISVSSVSKVSSKVYRINFPQQSSTGDYTVEIGPDIETPEGTAMNQDGDDTPGEAGDDVYQATLTVGAAPQLDGIVIHSMGCEIANNVITVRAGQRFGGDPLRLLIQNMSADWTNLDVTYYLSDDANVTTDDFAHSSSWGWIRLDAGEYMEVSIDAGVDGDYRAFKVPETAGTYYIKAKLDDTWSDLITVNVLAPANDGEDGKIKLDSVNPEITVSGLNPNKTSFQKGESYRVEMLLTNTGEIDYIPGVVNLTVA